MSAYTGTLIGNLQTVGDLIIAVRALGPDPPLAVMQPPAIIAPVGATLTGGILPVGTYFVLVTQLNPWGESLPVTEAPVTLAAGQNGFTIVVTPDIGAIAIRVYLGTVTGFENRYMQFTQITPGVPNTLNFTGLGVQAGAAPVSPSAFLPDSDGGFASAATMFRWLNDALQACSRICGGVQDAVGIASTSGQRRYITAVIGQWTKVDHAFYDGWELEQGTKAETFRNRNLTANISISFMVDAQSNQTRFELYWTPARTSGVAFTSAAIGATDINIPITQVSGWLLADGFVSISDGINTEVLSYSAQTGVGLQNCIRGWSGTQPFAFAAGSVVRELNIEINGYRQPYTYSVGQSNLFLGVPPGWQPFLTDWMLGRFRMAEQETQEGQSLQQGAEKRLVEWVRSNKQIAGPRQCRIWDDRGLRGIVPGGITGGIIIP